MILLLSFLLAWLCGLLVIYISAFFLYDEFSIIDITSFAVLTLTGSLLVILLLYQLTLKLVRKMLNKRNQSVYYPIILILITNIPVYYIIWLNAGDLYGKEEAMLFTWCFVTTAAVFGCCTAWKERLLRKQDT